MVEKYLLFDLDNEKSKKLGEVISNETCKKIVNLIAESDKELSETDIAGKMKIPVNTVEYNLKKLLEAGIIEKSKNFFWSVKGKKIEMYKVANKLIVIAPKKSNVYGKLKGIIPSLLIIGLLSLFIYFYYSSNFIGINLDRVSGIYDEKTYNETSEIASLAGKSSSYNDIGDSNTLAGNYNPPTSSQNQFTKNFSSQWIFFVLGGVIAVFVIIIWNWKKL